VEFFSPYIIAGLAGWLIAQSLKYVVASFKGGGLASFRKLYVSGNMPSAHSATIVAVLTVIGLVDGVGSGLFGFAFAMTTIVLYDAVMVRRSSGEQGESLTHLIKEQRSKVKLPRVAKGHTPIEVIVGSIIGLMVGIVVVLMPVFG
jgi:acid phosphatase family membrane protein YuiD